MIKVELMPLSLYVKVCFFKHMTAVVRELVQSKLNPGRYRYRWNNLGLDPHFLHAFTYALIATERKKKVFNFDFI